jgi:hypothetical protein
MATEAYWQKERELLFRPGSGGVERFVPMSEIGLVRAGPFMANSDVVKLFVLGHATEASAILDYVPRLEAIVRAERGLAHGSISPWSLSSLSFGIWLRTGAFDHEIATWAFSATHEEVTKAKEGAKGKQIDNSTLTLILASGLECDDDEAVWQLYQAHHKAPLDRVPDDKRLLAGPQHLLGLTARIAKDPAGKERLLEALKVFAARARHWDRRIDPVPYVSIVPLTRILVQCLRRLDESPRREDLWALIR